MINKYGVMSCLLVVIGKFIIDFLPKDGNILATF
jgi:hypothetical protein